MKVKILFIVIIFSINGLLSAQNLNLKFKQYSDNINGYNGVVTAVYIDNLEKYNLELESSELNEIMIEFFEKMFNELFPSIGTKIDKLSNNYYWLCQQALNELNVKKEDIYLIFCAENMSPKDFVIIMVIIGNDGKSFTWWGKNILTNELE